MESSPRRFCFFFFFTSLCDWSRNLAPLSQSDTKLKQITTWSSAFSCALGSLLFSCWVLISSLRYFSFFWLAFVTTSVLVLIWIHRKALWREIPFASRKVYSNLLNGLKFAIFCINDDELDQKANDVTYISSDRIITKAQWASII